MMGLSEQGLFLRELLLYFLLGPLALGDVPGNTNKINERAVLIKDGRDRFVST